MNRPRSNPYAGATRAFSLVEMLVAATIAALILSVAALAFGVVSQNGRRLSTYGSIEIGNAAAANYYSLASQAVDSYTAPNYGRAASADRLREIFWEDVENASAVYCLARTGLNTVRPVYIPFPAANDGRTLDSPEAFRLHLASVLSQTSTIYQSWRGVSNYPNGSIYILQPSGFHDFLAVRAIYDIDIQSTTNPSGTYASVKRYSWNTLTDFYDVFYPAGANAAPFKPIFVHHERRAKLRVSESGYDDYKTAADMPFFFIWWPDPAAPSLAKDVTSASATFAGSIPPGAPNPLPNYTTMGGRTSFFFTVPLFPSQL